MVNPIKPFGPNERPPRPSLTAPWLMVLLVTALYVGSAALGHLVGVIPGGVAAMWPPAGVALAAFLLWGNRIWPGVWLGAFLLGLWSLMPTHGQLPVLPAPLIGITAAIGATLQAWLGAAWLRPTLGSPPTLAGIPAVVRLLVLGGLVSCLINASLHTTVLALGHVIPWSLYGSTWLTGWLGDVASVQLVTPLILALANVDWHRLQASRQELVKWLVFLLALVATTDALFGSWSPLARTHDPPAFVLTPFLVIAALRFGLLGAALTPFLVALFAIHGTAAGLGPFAMHRSLSETLLYLDGFLSTIALSTLALAAAIQTEARKTMALCESQKLLSTVIEGISDVIMLKDRQGCYRLINAAGALIIGRPASEIVGKDDADLFPPETARALAARDREVMDSGQATTFEEILDVQGERRLFRTTKAPQRNEEGAVVGLIGIAIDITRTKQLEAQRQQLAALRQAADLKNQFVSILSHELRTPLTIILGYGNLLRQEMIGPLNEPQRQAAEKIVASANTQLSLVNDLLDMGKIVAGRFSIQPECLSLPPLLREIVAHLSVLAEQKAQHLTWDQTGALPQIEADKRRIGQVFTNLISNAIKFSGRGATIRISVRKVGKQVRCEVTDTGPGIAPEQISRLFQPFQQIDGGLARQAGGTGLGLAICREIVEAHGGRIGVRSVVAEGSTFWFTIPIRQAGVQRGKDLPFAA